MRLHNVSTYSILASSLRFCIIIAGVLCVAFLIGCMALVLGNWKAVQLSTRNQLLNALHCEIVIDNARNDADATVSVWQCKE